MTGAFLTALFFASNAVCARRAALHYGGTTGNFLRLLLAVALLAAWAHAAGQGVGGGALAWFFLSGAVGFGLGGLTMFHALPLLGSNLSMLIVLAFPFIGIYAGWLLRLGLRKIRQTG